MAAAADPVSAIANAAGDIVGAVGNVTSSYFNMKSATQQAAAQKYMAGQMTEQEYIRLTTSQDNNLSATVSQILAAGDQKTNYLPMILIGGIILAVVVIASKKSITV